MNAALRRRGILRKGCGFRTDSPCRAKTGLSINLSIQVIYRLTLSLQVCLLQVVSRCGCGWAWHGPMQSDPVAGFGPATFHAHPTATVARRDFMKRLRLAWSRFKHSQKSSLEELHEKTSTSGFRRNRHGSFLDHAGHGRRRSGRLDHQDQHQSVFRQDEGGR